MEMQCTCVCFVGFFFVFAVRLPIAMVEVVATMDPVTPANQHLLDSVVSVTLATPVS